MWYNKENKPYAEGKNMNEKISDRLKARRTELGLSLRDLSQKTRISSSTLQRYETGKIEKLPVENMKIIAGALKTTAEELLGMGAGFEASAAVSAVFGIPVFDSVSAGFGCYADSSAVGSKPTYLENAAEAGDYLWINVKGDSMSPKIEDGDMILVRRQDSVESGSVAVVMVDDEAFVKKLKYGKGWAELHSFNPYYPVRRFEKKETRRISVVGLVKEVCKKL